MNKSTITGRSDCCPAIGWYNEPCTCGEKMKYKTRDIDFTGCHPAIAEAIKNGKGILCKVSSREDSIFINGYSCNDFMPYRNIILGTSHSEATPIEINQKVKSFSEIIRMLAREDYDLRRNGNFHLLGEQCFTLEMFNYCGQEPSIAYIWRPEWLKEVGE